MRWKLCRTLMWVLVLALAMPSLARAQDVWFSVGSRILQLTLPSTATTVVYGTTGGPMVGDIAFCGDKSLFFSQGDVVKRLDLVASNAVSDVATVIGPKEIRLSYRATGQSGRTCDVHIASASGNVFLYKFDPLGTPQWTGVVEYAAPPPGSGLAVGFGGGLRVSSGNIIIPVAPSAATNTTAPGPVVGLGIAHHGEGSLLNVLQNAPLEGDGALCASIANTIRCGSRMGGSTLPNTVATFVERDIQAQYFEPLYDDRLIAAVTVLTVPKVGGTFNGILKSISSYGVVQELYRAPKDPGTNMFPPIIGVAVGPSSSTTLTRATPVEVRYGPVIVGVTTPTPCVLDLQLGQLTWADGEKKINSAKGNPGGGNNAYAVDPGLGSESLLDNLAIKINPQSPSTDCGMPADRARVVISQYNDGSRNKAVLKCVDDSNPLTSTPADSCHVRTLTSFSFSPDLPEDPPDVGDPDGFSEFITAEVLDGPVFGPGILFGPPLNDIPGPSPNDAVLSSLAVFDDAVSQDIVNRSQFATVHSQSAGMAIFFRICATEACNTFNDAEAPNPPASGAGLAIIRFVIENTASGMVATPIGLCVPNTNGGANPFIPVFRAQGQTSHVFNLNTPLFSVIPPPTGDDPCALTGSYALAPGATALFGAAPFSMSGKFQKMMILFKLQNQMQ